MNKKRKVDKALIITSNEEKEVFKVGKNIEGLSIESVRNINIYEVMRSKNLVFLKSSLEDLKKVNVKDK